MLVIVFFRDHGICEGAEGSESGSTLPDGKLTVSGDNESDLGLGLGGDLLLQTFMETLIHGGTT